LSRLSEAFQGGRQSTRCLSILLSEGKQQFNGPAESLERPEIPKSRELTS